MNRTVKFVTALLAFLAALDVVAAPLASRVTGNAKPPQLVPFVMGLLVVLTLVAIYGLARGATWARTLIYVTRALDSISGLLGILTRPSPELVGIGAATIVLSVTVVWTMLKHNNERSIMEPARS
jgi:hypothetical protein